MLNDLASVMFDEAALAAKCREMGQELTRDYEGKDLLVCRPGTPDKCAAEY